MRPRPRSGMVPARPTTTPGTTRHRMTALYPRSPRHSPTVAPKAIASSDAARLNAETALSLNGRFGSQGDGGEARVARRLARFSRTTHRPFGPPEGPVSFSPERPAIREDEHDNPENTMKSNRRARVDDDESSHQPRKGRLAGYGRSPLKTRGQRPRGFESHSLRHHIGPGTQPSPEGGPTGQGLGRTQQGGRTRSAGTGHALRALSRWPAPSRRAASTLTTEENDPETPGRGLAPRTWPWDGEAMGRAGVSDGPGTCQTPAGAGATSVGSGRPRSGAAIRVPGRPARPILLRSGAV